MYEGFPIITPLGSQIFEKIVTPSFKFDHLPTQLIKSPYWLQGIEYAIIFTHFFGGLASTELFVSKTNKQKKVFSLGLF